MNPWHSIYIFCLTAELSWDKLPFKIVNNLWVEKLGSETGKWVCSVLLHLEWIGIKITLTLDRLLIRRGVQRQKRSRHDFYILHVPQWKKRHWQRELSFQIPPAAFFKMTGIARLYIGVKGAIGFFKYFFSWGTYFMLCTLSVPSKMFSV